MHRIKVHRRKNSRAEWKFVVDLRRFKKGIKFFHDSEDGKKEAQIYADRINFELSNHGTERSISPTERNEFLVAREKLVGSGMDILQAVDFALKFSRPKSPVLFSQAIDLFEIEKKKTMCRQNYLDKMRTVLGSLNKFCPGKFVHDFLRDDIEQWLQTKKSPSTKHFYLQDVRAFFAFSIRRGWAKMNPCAEIEDFKLDEAEKGILTPAQAQALLETCLKNDPVILRYFADQLLGGLRENEAESLGKEDVHKSYLHLSKTKTRNQRFIEFNPTWKRWLAQCKDPEYSPIKSLRKRVDKIKELAKEKMVELKISKPDFQFPKNCLRHSFCTYGAPVFGADKTARLAGHSESTQKNNYRRPVPLKEAKDFWKISPS